MSVSEITPQKLAGLTNNNYLLKTTNENYVLRIPRIETNKNINRNHEAYNADIAYQLGLAPKVIWREKEQENFTGMHLVIAIDHPQTLTFLDWNNAEVIDGIAQSLVALQTSKQVFKGRIDNQSIAMHLNEYFQLFSIKQQCEFQVEHQNVLKLLDDIKYCDRTAVPSHIDLVAENILLNKNRNWLIDWEYSAMASPFWDIATICNEAKFDDEQAKCFLKKVLSDSSDDDFKCLLIYRLIVQTVSHFWYAAYVPQ
jgi:thiamine kinase-like enzyme